MEERDHQEGAASVQDRIMALRTYHGYESSLMSNESFMDFGDTWDENDKWGDFFDIKE